MSRINFIYTVEDRPPLWLTLVYGVQWLAVSVPFVIILGNSIAGMLYPEQPELRQVYLQKTFLVTGIYLLIQLLIGHKLPLLAGPASVLLVGIAANSGAEPAALSGAAAIGGLLLTILSLSKVSARLGALFSTRIIGVVLLLIAFTMLPTIIKLITAADNTFINLAFSICLLTVMLASQRLLAGPLASLLVLLSLTVGSMLYFLITDSWPQELSFRQLSGLSFGKPDLAINPGVLLSFLFCYAALWVNDLGSLQATAALTAAAKPEGRLKLGLAVTGLGNLLAGVLGVVGPVNYSLSAGLISASKCASRYTLFPCAAGLIALALLPGAVWLFSAIPSTVTGSLLLYMMGSQVAAGLAILRETFADFRYEDGLIVGFPLLLGTLSAFLPAEIILALPKTIRPLLANGFVVGTVAAMLLEHVVFRKR